MARSTDCVLTVPLHFHQATIQVLNTTAQPLFDDPEKFDDTGNVELNNKLVNFKFPGQISGTNPYQKALIDAGIPYDWDYNALDSIDYGTEYVRFTKEGFVLLKAGGDEKEPALNCQMVLRLFDTKQAYKVRRVAYITLCNNYIPDLNHNDQIINSKRYQLRCMVSEYVPAYLPQLPRREIPKEKRLSWLDWS